ncbi:protein-L-isoaspartate O-methyltransferase [Acetobacter sp. TBRC 12305]|uniref:Protein-L-isoaspartate O-methyltransferase n=2 Tax=Acetobacter garciniae TaxID=2817435 RepID=A0A939HMS3_9PROT|nr:protein-L-isoaspartate O-methyltransferase [Acetobacter garciniae]MBO1324232.1 protein-L-isoaspartate O-methyltransferase [Acetobacter garciniae]MBX0343921.1 protein-L-isoaspartate O-methyltransferase [Acetobacter garciniae]
MSQTGHDMWAEARNLMVDDQLRPSEISNPGILKAMRALPREECVQPAQRAAAYADVSLPLAPGRVLAQPLLTARLAQAANPLPGEHALVVGAATGYSAGVLARLGLVVSALECDEQLAAMGQAFCKANALAVQWSVGPLNTGLPANGPYDLIYFDGCVGAVPDFCQKQLKPGGRLVGLIQKTGDIPEIFRATLTATQEGARYAFAYLSKAQSPLLPGLCPQPQFSL